MRLLLAAGADPNARSKYKSLALGTKHIEIVKMLLVAGADPNLDRGAGRTVLNSAAYNGNIELIKVLLEAGANPNAEDLGGTTPLDSARMNGQTEAVALLAAAGAGRPRDGGKSALHEAAESGDAEAIARLISGGADPNAKDKFDRTPLHTAAWSRNAAAAKALLKGGANVGAADRYGRLALEAAMFIDDVEMINTLLGAGATLTSGKVGLLGSAVKGGHIKVIDALLKAGTNPNERDEVGKRPLHWLPFTATDVDDKAMQTIIERLVAAGGDPNGRSKEHYTALYDAVLHDDAHAVRILISQGADPNLKLPESGTLKDGGSGTALHHAKNEEVAKALLGGGADPGATDRSGNTPLHRAASRRKPEIARVLIANGANPLAKDSYGHTALVLAHENTAMLDVLMGEDARVNPHTRDARGRTLLHNASSAEVVRRLLSAGADVDAKDEDRATALHLAVIDRREAVVEALIAGGADVNARDGHGETPLHDAARRDAGLVAVLAAAGAEVDARNRNGRTPLYYAKGEARRALIERGADSEVVSRARREAKRRAAAKSEREAAWLAAEEARLKARWAARANRVQGAIESTLATTNAMIERQAAAVRQQRQREQQTREAERQKLAAIQRQQAQQAEEARREAQRRAEEARKSAERQARDTRRQACRARISGTRNECVQVAGWEGGVTGWILKNRCDYPISVLHGLNDGRELSSLTDIGPWGAGKTSWYPEQERNKGIAWIACYDDPGVNHKTCEPLSWACVDVE